jgi:hypothetical protein
MGHYRKDNVVAREILDETLLVPIRGQLADMQRLFVLEGVGEFIWNSMDGKKTTAEIAREIVAEFDVMPEEAERDLTTFLARLREMDLAAEAP